MLPQPLALKSPQGLACFHYGAYFDYVPVTLSEFKPSCQERFLCHFNALFEHQIFRLQHRRFVN